MGHDAERRAHSALRCLILDLESEPDVEPNEADRLVRQLRSELKNLDVDSVTRVTAENMPVGAKGVDSWSVGALMITFAATGGVFTALIETVRDWLARHAVARRISVTIDGDTIELEKASAQERSDLIEAYIRRHEVE